MSALRIIAFVWFFAGFVIGVIPGLFMFGFALASLLGLIGKAVGL